MTIDEQMELNLIARLDEQFDIEYVCQLDIGNRDGVQREMLKLVNDAIERNHKSGKNAGPQGMDLSEFENKRPPGGEPKGYCC